MESHRPTVRKRDGSLGRTNNTSFFYLMAHQFEFSIDRTKSNYGKSRIAAEMRSLIGKGGARLGVKRSILFSFQRKKRKENRMLACWTSDIMNRDQNKRERKRAAPFFMIILLARPSFWYGPRSSPADSSLIKHATAAPSTVCLNTVCQMR